MGVLLLPPRGSKATQLFSDAKSELYSLVKNLDTNAAISSAGVLSGRAGGERDACSAAAAQNGPQVPVGVSDPAALASCA